MTSCNPALTIKADLRIGGGEWLWNEMTIELQPSRGADAWGGQISFSTDEGIIPWTNYTWDVFVGAERERLRVYVVDRTVSQSENAKYELVVLKYEGVGPLPRAIGGPGEEETSVPEESGETVHHRLSRAATTRRRDPWVTALPNSVEARSRQMDTLIARALKSPPENDPEGLLSSVSATLLRGDPNQTLKQVRDVRWRMSRIADSPSQNPGLQAVAATAAAALMAVEGLLDGSLSLAEARPTVRGLDVLAVDGLEWSFALAHPAAAAAFKAIRIIVLFALKQRASERS